MGLGVTTYGFRRRLAQHLATGNGLPRVAFMAFGDGGHNADGTPKVASPNQTKLNRELLRKGLSVVTQEDSMSVTGTGRIEKSELIGKSISEAGLLDASGNLIGLKNFSPKIKDDDEYYDISIKIDV
ncbi:MAG: hypothetical protein EOM02_11970 [Synergistales bacterium]|nr:hypothetical protein [Synergistales bacterium]